MALPTKQPWQQETLWIQRNTNGVIINISEKPPEDNNFIPQGPRLAKRKDGSE